MDNREQARRGNRRATSKPSEISRGVSIVPWLTVLAFESGSRGLTQTSCPPHELGHLGSRIVLRGALSEPRDGSIQFDSGQDLAHVGVGWHDDPVGYGSGSIRLIHPLLRLGIGPMGEIGKVIEGAAGSCQFPIDGADAGWRRRCVHDDMPGDESAVYEGARLTRQEISHFFISATDFGELRSRVRRSISDLSESILNRSGKERSVVLDQVFVGNELFGAIEERALQGGKPGRSEESQIVIGILDDGARQVLQKQPASTVRVIIVNVYERSSPEVQVVQNVPVDMDFAIAPRGDIVLRFVRVREVFEEQPFTSSSVVLDSYSCAEVGTGICDRRKGDFFHGIVAAGCESVEVPLEIPGIRVSGDRFHPDDQGTVLVDTPSAAGPLLVKARNVDKTVPSNPSPFPRVANASVVPTLMVRARAFVGVHTGRRKGARHRGC